VWVNTADGVAPSAPTGLTAAAASGTAVALAWQPSIDNRGVAGYLVSRDGVQIGRADYALTFEDGGLPSGRYCYTLKAFDLAGNQSAQSAEACATLPDVTPPSAPTGVYAAWFYIFYSGVTDLTWEAATDDVGVAEYRIRRCGYVWGGCSDYGYWKSTTETSEMAIWEGMLNYCYVVSAVDAAGNESPPSAQACDIVQ
jgi:hypothetical protein